MAAQAGFARCVALAEAPRGGCGCGKAGKVGKAGQADQASEAKSRRWAHSVGIVRLFGWTHDPSTRGTTSEHVYLHPCIAIQGRARHDESAGLGPR